MADLAGDVDPLLDPLSSAGIDLCWGERWWSLWDDRMVNEHLVELNISNREHVEVEWDVLLECAAHQEIHELTSLIRCLGSWSTPANSTWR